MIQLREITKEDKDENKFIVEEIDKYILGELNHPLFLINNQPKIKFEKIANFRDLSRIYFDNKKRPIKVKENMIYRSAVPLSATELDEEQLFQKFRINTWIDLRSTNETDLQPFPEKFKKSKVQYFKMNFLSRTRSMLGVLFKAGNLKSTTKLISAKISGNGMKDAVQHFADNVNQVELYKVIASTCSAEISQTLKLVSNEYMYPVVFFCSHGRDRTGIISALLLHILGVCREQICAEYYQSHYGGFDDQIEVKGLKGFTSLTMWKLFDYFEEKYGGTDKYLDSIGITHGIRKKIRTCLLEDYEPSPQIPHKKPTTGDSKVLLLVGEEEDDYN